MRCSPHNLQVWACSSVQYGLSPRPMIAQRFHALRQQPLATGRWSSGQRMNPKPRTASLQCHTSQPPKLSFDLIRSPPLELFKSDCRKPSKDIEKGSSLVRGVQDYSFLCPVSMAATWGGMQCACSSVSYKKHSIMLRPREGWQKGRVAREKGGRMGGRRGGGFIPVRGSRCVTSYTDDRLSSTCIP